jgi:hypothetical protein
MSSKDSQFPPAKSSVETGTIDKQRGIFALIVRPFWMFFGNFALMICVANVIMGESNSTRVSDIIFWSVAAALIIVRFLDIKFLDGQTATGEPATIKHWRRYAIALAVISAAIWSAAHVTAYLFKS